MMRARYGEVVVVVVVLLSSAVHGHVEAAQPRSFEIDYATNQFLKDGQPHRYVAGSIHYFRVLPADWPNRLWKLRMAGFNAVQTYIEWSTHEPRHGEYHFNGTADVEAFIRMAQKLDLDVILRIGPYMCGERDMGGLPYWLLKLHPDIRLRSSDPAFIQHMDHWLGEILLPKIRPLLYENGGPIIMVQLENEYGCLLGLCDHRYTAHLRDLTREVLGSGVVLFTVDNPLLSHLLEGKIPEVYATVDFGVGKNPHLAFLMQRLFESHGPLVNSEYYPGWLDYWGEPHHTVDTKEFAEGLDAILSLNASVSVYVFHGGTSFGLTAGANTFLKYQANPTSYDYDAPLSEAGDPTDKYTAIRDVLSKYLPVPSGPVPGPERKGNYGQVNMMVLASLWDVVEHLSTIHSSWPLTFEHLDLPAGLVIYSTSVPFRIPDPARLSLYDVHDRGYVFVAGREAGVVSREQHLTDVAVQGLIGDTLTVVVESHGRITAGPHINDFKGLTSNVTLNGHYLKGWNMTAVPLADASFLPLVTSNLTHASASPGTSRGGLTFYKGVFMVPDEDPHPLNTFLKLDGWTKGVAWVNKFCLGRYWPVVGPQLTLYVPWSVLKQGENELILLELEAAPCPASAHPCAVTLQEEHVIDGPTPL